MRRFTRAACMICDKSDVEPDEKEKRGGVLPTVGEKEKKNAAARPLHKPLQTVNKHHTPTYGAVQATLLRYRALLQLSQLAGSRVAGLAREREIYRPDATACGDSLKEVDDT